MWFGTAISHLALAYIVLTFLVSAVAGWYNHYPDGDLKFSAEVMEGRFKNQMFPLESGYLE
jgi:hypothetical protein